MIYLDNSATTKPDESVVRSYTKVATDFFANPSSIHIAGGEVEKLVSESRKQIASLLGIHEKEVFFTSGGTESNNMAIQGIAYAHQKRGNHIITSAIEHPSVLGTCQQLEREGFQVTYLPVNETGKISIDDLKNAMREETILVTLMHVNNEIGSIQPIEQVADVLKEWPAAHFHVDHVQGFGKVSLPYSHEGIDLMTISGHKIHGLKGTGLLLKRRGVTVKPLFYGGGQQDTLRPGTENPAGAVSLAKAMRLALEQQRNYPSVGSLNRTLRDRLKEIPNIQINSPDDAIANILNFSVLKFKPEVLIHALGEEGIMVSTKSACSSKQNEPSHVLLACGFDTNDTAAAIRVSMHMNQSKEDIDTFLTVLYEKIKNIEELMG
ncbi:cysteine desulfurase family protein [Allobacillus halotolerans]|uniref:Cysteine desulfurase n=1 Tax=Allobacillus halotolerans TaxID=570278 RepID=A0ABS6GMQ3_9BACI|nr:cysteine desulfurase family protein [Allobacillus halotolerans]MBU6080230.1 cysteine desulfurase [Allobacillus halotolerans]